jgi:hypothetical protein
MTLADLSTHLWRQRELLELLLFKLEAEHLLLANGRHEWVPRATREVEMVLERIGEAELTRAAVVDGVATALGLPSDASLRVLAESAPEPWSTVLFEHRAAFLQLTERVSAAAESNRDLVSTARRAADRLLLDMREDERTPTPYQRTGVREPSTPRRSVLLDEEI